MERGWLSEPGGWTDPDSGLEGPDFWQRILVAEVARSEKYGRPLSVVVVEVDGLLRLVETRGEAAGRVAMRRLGQMLRRASRASDYCTRIGLTRFGVVLTETDEVAAINFVERVREDGPRALPRGARGVRFNFGWASPTPGESAQALALRAEGRLIAELMR